MLYILRIQSHGYFGGAMIFFPLAQTIYFSASAIHVFCSCQTVCRPRRASFIRPGKMLRLFFPLQPRPSGRRLIQFTPACASALPRCGNVAPAMAMVTAITCQCPCPPTAWTCCAPSGDVYAAWQRERQPRTARRCSHMWQSFAAWRHERRTRTARSRRSRALCNMKGGGRWQYWHRNRDFMISGVQIRSPHLSTWSCASGVRLGYCWKVIFSKHVINYGLESTLGELLEML
jgi:hypothetical protein